MSMISSIPTDVVLGIDAAWTNKNPSGVALAARRNNKWSLEAVADSYESFYCPPKDSNESLRPSGSELDVDKILQTAREIAGKEIDLIAIDMPLAFSKITGRRSADNEVSKKFGAMKCSAHSPSEIRPGSISDRIREQFSERGYPLQVQKNRQRGVIEIYPHTALLKLMIAPQRLPYKYAKIAKYWPEFSVAKRKELLIEQWRDIVRKLEDEIGNSRKYLMLPSVTARGWEFKSFEDRLDAVVSVWMGIQYLEGNASPLGDEDAAIWIHQERFVANVLEGNPDMNQDLKRYKEFLDRLIEIGREGPAELSDKNEKIYFEHSGINRKHWSFYEKHCESITTEEVINLFRGLVIAEREYQLSGGSVAANIWVLRILQERITKFETRSLLEWAMKNRGTNLYTPTGSPTADDFR